MLEAVRNDRRNIPCGIVSQKPITFPKTRASTPASRRNAAVESAYGPAPTIATLQLLLIPVHPAVELASVCGTNTAAARTPQAPAVGRPARTALRRPPSARF